ncbi:MAG: tRNA guanosine(34) transglycosylase Tgt [Holosporaceae bacterium]|jgi:queuine tRNA-ribosyltransferase|nr:tRNA guanosine(34) transglycosylase Tgt [Holosporaceae bacterium]
MYRNFGFDVIDCYEKSRAGLLKTPHGEIETPAFIFCGTKATVKGLFPCQLIDAGTQLVLSNTYHLFSNPGADSIKKRGGLHKFMGWPGPLLTDSGGFQIFSLGHGSVADEIKGRRSGTSNLIEINEQGAVFKSYWDGNVQLLTPEKSVETQRNLGADLIVAFDECTPYHSDKNYTAAAMERSHRWEKRSLEEFIRGNDFSQAIYGVVQGGVYLDLRKRSAEFVNENPFFATAIGGTLGASKEQMYEVVEMAMDGLDAVRPIHLLGIGGIADIFRGVALGIDTFDCVHPTRIARHGNALVKVCHRTGDSSREHINLWSASCSVDDDPIEPDCDCFTCKNFSRAYLHYLLKARELLAPSAITIHNVRFMNRLMEEIRGGIINKNLKYVKDKWC